MGTDTSPRPRLAVVTGASSGIGYELAKHFAAHHFDLTVAAEDPGIHDASRRLAGLGVRVQAVQVDLAEAAGVDALWQQIEVLRRPVDAAAINAGLVVHGRFATQTDLDAELRLIKLNVVATVQLVKRLLPPMVRRGAGRILITPSVPVLLPGPHTAVYSASKAFLYAFAEAIRYELKDTGVHVTALLPGTPLGARDKSDPAVVARQGFEALMAGHDHVADGSSDDGLEVVTARIGPAAHTRPARQESDRS
jgi:short-subunit dehydrogenase